MQLPSQRPNAAEAPAAATAAWCLLFAATVLLMPFCNDVQVSDFGLSRAMHTESSLSTNTFGTVCAVISRFLHPLRTAVPDAGSGTESPRLWGSPHSLDAYRPPDTCADHSHISCFLLPPSR
jgi:hypothetical protein